MNIFNKLGCFFKDLSLKFKILIFFLAILIPIMSLVTAISYFYTSEVIEKNVNTYMVQIINEVKNNIEYNMNDVENISRFILYDDVIQEALKSKLSEKSDMDIKTVKAILTNLANYKSFVDTICIAGENGIIITYGSGNSTMFDFDIIKNKVWYLDAMKKKGGFGWYRADYDISTTYSEKHFTLVRIINDKYTNKKIGSVIINVNENFFNSLFDRIKIGETGSIFIVDNLTKSVLSTNEMSINSQQLTSFMDAITTPAGSFTKTVQGEKKQIVYSQFQHSNWTLLGVVPFSEVDKDARLIRDITVLLLVVGILIAIIFSLVVSTSILKPLFKVVALMKEAEKGDFSVRISDNRNDEVGILSKTFNRMVEKLDTLVYEVYYENLHRKDAELQALQAQINPHFLYNTLDTINWMSLIKGEEEISKMVMALSKVFRLSLGKGNKFVTIEHEVEHIRNYLIIQTCRYKERLNVELDVDKNIMKYKTIRTVLQPLIENSIKHGIDHTGDVGFIYVRGYKDGSLIKFEISDNGVGIDEQKMAQILTNKENENGSIGYGVYNVNNRIKLAFGADYGLAYFNLKKGGTLVVITLPAVME